MRPDGSEIGRLHSSPMTGPAGFQFHPELFDFRALAMEGLTEAEYQWFSHYSSVDLVHDEYGLEVCGIRHEDDAVAMMGILEKVLPGWRAYGLHLKQHGREPGWKFTVVRTPRAGGDGHERIG